MMWTPSLTHMEDNEEKLIFKGAFFELAPLTIPLCALVLAQNIVIFVEYYKDRSKFVASMFMGIAGADILKAQGEMVLAGLSLLVYTGHLDIMVLYNGLFYYMVTALPGVNCSKVFNLALSICLTMTVVNPFRRLNNQLLRKTVASICLIITLLHILDTVAAVFVHLTVLNGNKSYLDSMAYLFLMISFDVPGAIAIGTLVCMPDDQGTSKCLVGDEHAMTHHQMSGIIASFGALYYMVPPFIVLICMVIQIRHLKKSLGEREAECPLPDTSRHVSITIFLVSTLFFVCHATFLIATVIWFALHRNIMKHDLKKRVFLDWGVMLGFVKFSLPLLYSMVYPIILISRKRELRERFLSYLRRATTCCTRRNHPDIGTDQQ